MRVLTWAAHVQSVCPCYLGSLCDGVLSCARVSRVKSSPHPTYLFSYVGQPTCRSCVLLVTCYNENHGYNKYQGTNKLIIHDKASCSFHLSSCAGRNCIRSAEGFHVNKGYRKTTSDISMGEENYVLLQKCEKCNVHMFRSPETAAM